MTSFSELVSRIEQGDAEATEQLFPLVYDELRRLAAAKLAAEKPGQTLQATALVHEAYLRLIHSSQRDKWQSQTRFFNAATEAMRRILVDVARRKSRQKHGGQRHRVDLEADVLVAEESADELVALNDALEQLEREDAQAAQLVKLRYFAGSLGPFSCRTPRAGPDGSSPHCQGAGRGDDRGRSTLLCYGTGRGISTDDL